ncbi:helix-turn-helix domain-containing protein [Streptomyces cirratus]|nr:MerR family transcriptional regulator [Streptomyces cirratus]
MNGTTSLHSIGSLSTRTGVPVRTIRFYSDSGLLPPTQRTSAGYRCYDDAALLRLRTICVLRELDVDLASIRRVLGGSLSVTEVAAAHADATELQIRVLRRRQSVLRHLARRGSSPEEISFMHRLTSLTTGERHRLITDFIDDLTARTSTAGSEVAALRTAFPDLPDDPSDAQLAAWVELAELMTDDDFRARMARGASAAAPADEDVLPGIPAETAADLMAVARQAAGVAMEAGADPEGEDATVVVDGVVAHFAAVLGRPDSRELREWMASRFEAGHDPLVERYFRLVWTVNDWHVVPGHLPFQPWIVKVLRRPRPNERARPRK